MMNLKVLAMAIAYSSGCEPLAPDIQIKVDQAIEALSPNAYRASRRHRVHENHEKQCQVLKTQVEKSTK